MRKTPISQAKTAFNKAKNILIIAPEHAPTDTVCAALALQAFCKQKKKESICVLPTNISQKLGFLEADTESIQSKLKEKQPFTISVSTKNGLADRIKYSINDDTIDITISPKEGFFLAKDVACVQQQEPFDLIITLNTDSLEDLGENFSSAPEVFTQSTVINIGSHITNDEYGTVNLVDTNRSGVSELVYDFIVESNTIDRSIATILLSGITSHTESFLGRNTSASSFETAGKLQKQGADHSQVIDEIFKMKSLATLKIWGRIMGNLQHDPVLKISWATLSKADFEIAEASNQDLETITKDMLCHIGETEIALLFFEDETSVQAQIATSKENIDIRDLQPGIKENIVSHAPHYGEITFTDRRASDAEHDVLIILTKFQQYRLGLPNTNELSPVEIEKIDTETTKPKEKTKKEPSSPRKIPFTAPVDETKKDAPNPQKKKPSSNKPKWLE